MTQIWQNEQDVRAGLTAMGMRDQLSEAEFELSVRGELRRIEERASTPLVSMRSALKTIRQPASPIPLPPRQFNCAVCEDLEFVFTGTRTIDRDRVVRTNPVACPACVPLATRARQAGIDGRFLEARIETMRVHPGNAAAVAYGGTWDGERSVLITSRDKAGDSKWGTGKTHLACAMLIGQIAKGRAARFLPVKQFLTGIQGQFGGEPGAVEAYIDLVAGAPLLVLDDLGAERATDWAVEQMRTLFDTRYRRRLTTIVTTNFTSYDEITYGLVDESGRQRQGFGGAVASRLREYAWITVGGADMRGVA